jgi:hypothetical protein
MQRNFMEYRFPMFLLCIYFDKKTGWAIFWATFSQTLVVTLHTSAWGLSGGVR